MNFLCFNYDFFANGMFLRYFQARQYDEPVGGVRGRAAWAEKKAASEQ